jgi:BCD family chlorophyll transporter-like MFS transporter
LGNVLDEAAAAGVVIFLIAFGDALLIIGVAIPATPLLFAVGTLTAAMSLERPGHLGLALGAWGATQAVAAGLAIAFGGILRDVVASSAVQGQFGAATGYMSVYVVEIILLVWTLVTMAPLIGRAVTSHASSVTP